MPEPLQQFSKPLLSTGIPGLDDVLGGGLVASSVYLIEGDPGSGKTTLSLQVLLEGVRLGEPTMFVSLSETRDELLTAAASHGWSLDGIAIHEVIASEESLRPDARYTMYHPSEVELIETIRGVIEAAAQVGPRRVVVDSIAALRLMADNALRYRRQILALKHHFVKRGATVLFVDDRTGDPLDQHLHSLAHGIIQVERNTGEYGAMRRRIQVTKLRGRKFREGYHDMVIRQGGIDVFPRLVATEHGSTFVREAVPSGLAQLDELLGGGLSRGTSTLVLGAAGTGKSSIAAQYVASAGQRGECSLVLLFDEARATYFERSAKLGFAIEPLATSGLVDVRQIDPAELSPGELSDSVRRAVEEKDCRLVVIDSLNGYLTATPGERFLALHLHELLTYLGRRGVTTILVMTQHGLLGIDPVTPVDVSYVADTVVLLRYFEADGEVRQAISVLKKRTGRHERSIRELFLGRELSIGEPLCEFRGVLTGVPEKASPTAGVKRGDASSA